MTRIFLQHFFSNDKQAMRTMKRYIFIAALLLNPLLQREVHADATLDALLQPQCQTPKFELKSEETSDGVRVRDGSFINCRGGIVQAYWLEPAQTSGKLPAILYVHWFEPRSTLSNRNEFLQEARTMAKMGVRSLLISTFWSIPGGHYNERHWEDDYNTTLHQGEDILLAARVLQSLPGTDSSRMAYVGHDYGAAFGAMVAATGTPFKTFVLMASCAKFPDWYLYGSADGVPEGAQLKPYKQQFDSINPQVTLGKSRAAIFLQFGEDDEFVSIAKADSLAAALPEGGRHAMYSSDHSLDDEQARAERIDWLRNQLRLGAAK